MPRQAGLGRVSPSRAAAVVIGFFVLMQVVPYGRNHTNPPVQEEPGWDRPETRTAFQSACANCHSNETIWPWYSHVAPVSWLVQHDVDEGRAKLNASEMQRPQKDAKEAAEVVRKGEMPPKQYLLMHPEARLSGAERQALSTGLAATFGTGEAGNGDETEDEN